MLVVEARLVVMAAGAAEGRSVVGCVALVARRPFAGVRMFGSAVDRKTDGRIYVVRSAERRRGRPGGLCVARCARVAQVHRGVVCRRRCTGISGLMTLPASRITQVVIAVHVTLCARFIDMRPGKWKGSAAVIECRRAPGRRGMALRARVRKLIRGVIRICNCSEVRLMALPAVGVGQRVISVLVARVAWLRLMRAGQREICGRMRKCRGCPGVLRVTGQAGGRELIGCVARIRRGVELRLMACDAVRVHKLIISVDMAILTLPARMRALQREVRRGVIKGRRFPRLLRVAREAVVAELPGAVVRVGSGFECVLMALPAVGVREFVVSVHVATLAGNGYVRALQRE